MKKLLMILVLSLFFNVLAEAKQLIPGTSLQLVSVDGLTQVEKLSAILKVSCRYKSGILWPEAKSCGQSEMNLSIENNGVIHIPSIDKFSGLHARVERNYDISLAILEEGNYLAYIAVYGSNLQNFKFNGAPLFLYRFNAASFDIAIQDTSIFNTNYAQKENAHLSLRFESSEGSRGLDELAVGSPLRFLNWYRENRNPYNGEVSLRDTKEVTLSAMSYASFTPPALEKIQLHVGYSEFSDYSLKTVFYTKRELQIKPEMLEEIQNIKLD